MRAWHIGFLALAMTAPAFAQERLPELKPEQMTLEQKVLYDALMAGPRHSTQGPFNAWLRSPVLGDRLQKVGEYLRYQTSMPRKLNEFAILITAVEWKSGFEWYAHYPLALQEGLEPRVAEELRQGRRPIGMSADETLVYDFATQMHRQRQVSDAVFVAAKARFGEQGVVDLTALLGYYTTVSMTLNLAEVNPPEDGIKTLAPPPKP
jgi:4-carboxymuconolactone decarboxylase